MTLIRFVSSDGSRMTEVAAGSNANLLEVAQLSNQPLEGTCEGQMTCSTCHVIVDPADFDRLPPTSEDEEDMLDLAVGVARTSRLACQITLDGSLDRLTVRMPSGSRNMQGR